MGRENKKIGHIGEEIALAFLEQRGYKILGVNAVRLCSLIKWKHKCSRMIGWSQVKRFQHSNGVRNANLFPVVTPLRVGTSDFMCCVDVLRLMIYRFKIWCTG